jgi:hypothetical protein
MLTAIEKVRQHLTGSPDGEPHFQHEGPDVTRWLTGGSIPDAYVTFHQQGDQIVLRCATCHVAVGCIPADYEREETARQILAVREAEHHH